MKIIKSSLQGLYHEIGIDFRINDKVLDKLSVSPFDTKIGFIHLPSHKIMVNPD